MLDRAKNLIQAVLLIPGKIQTSHSIYLLGGNYRAGGEAWSYAGACVVFWLWGRWWLFLWVLFPSYKVQVLVLHLWPRKTRKGCYLSAPYRSGVEWGRRLGSQTWGAEGALQHFQHAWWWGNWALPGLLVAIKSVISHYVGPGNLWLSIILFSFGRTLT